MSVKGAPKEKYSKRPREYNALGRCFMFYAVFMVMNINQSELVITQAFTLAVLLGSITG